MNLDDERSSVIFRELGSRVELPPTRIAVADLMSAGGRVRRRRRMAVGGAGALALGLAAVTGVAMSLGTGRPGPDDSSIAQAGASSPAGAAAAGPCTVERLPMPVGAAKADVDVFAGAPGGRYLVGNIYANSGARPVLWDGDKVAKIPIEASSAEVQGVNDSGVVVGEATRAGRHFGWAYVGGRVVELPTPDGYASAEANAVNARGEVAGIAMGDNRPSAAVVWRGLGGDVQAHRLDAPGSALAFGISDSGVVVGELEGTGAYVWESNGHGRALAGPDGNKGGRAQGVRGDWAYGTGPVEEPLRTTPPTRSVTVPGPPGDGSPAAFGSNGVLWNLRANQAVGVGAGRVGAITSTGQYVVNTEDDKSTLHGADGSVSPLPSLITNGHSHAIAISEDGTLIAGVSSVDHGGQRPVRWHC